jgi:quercetin dioxygenase-like cupin family protein
MARSGEVVENPMIGDRVTWRKTAQETYGELLQYELVVWPAAKGPLAHIHPRQEERFEVLSGTLRARVGDREQTLGAGQSLAVAPGTPHTWWNDGHDEAHVRVEFRPALHFETILETGYGLARDGKTNEKGVPNPLQLGVMFNEYRDEIYLAALPIAVQKVLWALLGTIGKRLGYEARYPQYSGPEPEGEETTRRPQSGSGGRTEAVAAGLFTTLLALFLLARRQHRRSSGGR